MAANPTLLSMPIAENGTKNVIPETQATPGNGLMSQSTGFPAECSLPLGAGGVAPDRADFNGAFNLLGGVAFMAQKGFTFNYDAGQDYYKGCVVIDPNDGNRYLCIADMAAGTVAPSADISNTYWAFYQAGGVNAVSVYQSSGTFTAPVQGWYRITVKGGGGGGAGALWTNNIKAGGGGGGEGGTAIVYKYMTAGTTAAVVIGAGGAGGAGSTSSMQGGGNGGDTTVTIGENVYTGGGGKGGELYGGYGGDGSGGNYNIRGACGGAALRTYAPSVSMSMYGSPGGGNGGWSYIATGVRGGGGGGGYANDASNIGAGGAGGNGYVRFEYFAEV